MYDVLERLPEKTIKCLDKGFVKIIDCMPRLVASKEDTADLRITEAARTSYGEGTKKINQERDLIRYLYRHSHSTPTEFVEFTFLIKMPIFCARQFFRTRTASYNEYSARYSIVPDDYHIPDEVRAQSATNKQGSVGVVEEDNAHTFLAHLNEICATSYKAYQESIDNGVAREQARMLLPVNYYTQFYFKIDLHNLLHMLALRCDSHAQEEIREFAHAILSLIKPVVPIAVEAWEDYHPLRGAMKLTRLEVEALSSYEGGAIPEIDSDNKRERQEWVEKFNKIFGGDEVEY
jgi:thymidylate synthase (FAD)